jgi:TorA maturation chaperone TorD
MNPHVSRFSLALCLDLADNGSIAALKRCAHDFACQWMMSYLEEVQEDNNYNLLVVGQLIVQ